LINGIAPLSIQAWWAHVPLQSLVHLNFGRTGFSAETFEKRLKQYTDFLKKKPKAVNGYGKTRIVLVWVFGYTH